MEHQKTLGSYLAELHDAERKFFRTGQKVGSYSVAGLQLAKNEIECALKKMKGRK